jgi:uncharacterized protein YlxW (UPF0749 family)
MNKWIGMALILIALVAIGVTIHHARAQLRQARAFVSEALSENPSPSALQRQVTALQAECDKLKFDLAAAQSALVARAQNTTTTNATSTTNTTPTTVPAR